MLSFSVVNFSYKPTFNSRQQKAGNSGQVRRRQIFPYEAGMWVERWGPVGRERIFAEKNLDRQKSVP